MSTIRPLHTALQHIPVVTTPDPTDHRARLDAAVASVARSFETHFATKVACVVFTAVADYGTLRKAVCPSAATDEEKLALTRFFLDAARNAVCGIQEMLISDDEE